LIGRKFKSLRRMQNWLSLHAPALSRSGFDLEMTTYQATYRGDGSRHTDHPHT
jgi:hypothetical protein